jgi:hypothetical protein
MSPSPQENQISHLKEKIHELEEYLISDCCKRCLKIIQTIEDYQKEIEQLQTQIGT